MPNFYISITTIQKYKVALDMLLNSLPNEWKDKYILVYQNEHENGYEIFNDGHMEVYLKNNISDYGNWVGANILIINGIIPKDSYLLFIHDTCMFLGDSCVNLVNTLIETQIKENIDIYWMCNNGQCNICLISLLGIQYGYNVYKDIKYMTKMETIGYEWAHWHQLSPKSFKVFQKFIDIPTQHLGKKHVYSDVNRDILLYESINMQKYFVYIKNESEHPFLP